MRRFLLVALVVLAGCGSNPTPAPTPRPTVPAIPAKPAATRRPLPSLAPAPANWSVSGLTFQTQTRIGQAVVVRMNLANIGRVAGTPRFQIYDLPTLDISCSPSCEADAGSVTLAPFAGGTQQTVSLRITTAAVGTFDYRVWLMSPAGSTWAMRWTLRAIVTG